MTLAAGTLYQTGSGLSDAEVQEHVKESAATVRNLLKFADNGEADHAVLYSQRRHSQLDKVLELLLAHVAIGLHLGGNKRRELEERVIALEQRVKAAEAKVSETKFVGPWTEGKDYKAGNFVQSSGSLWHADRDTSTRPDHGAEDWTLTVRRGRDAKAHHYDAAS